MSWGGVNAGPVANLYFLTDLVKEVAARRVLHDEVVRGALGVREGVEQADDVAVVHVAQDVDLAAQVVRLG